jgi:hypothetical protein
MVVDWEFIFDKIVNMAAAKPEVVSILYINIIAEKFSRTSAILLDIYFAAIIAEHLIHNGICEIQNGG